MKLLICFILALSAVSGADRKSAPKASTPPKASNDKTKPQRQTAPAPKSVLPEGAVEISPGTFRYVDPDGKVWIYGRTPFGFSKAEEKEMNSSPITSPFGHRRVAGEAAPATGAASSPFGHRNPDAAKTTDAAPEHDPTLVATDAGESVRFEKSSPFGKSTWTRKKTELTPAERVAWEYAQKQGK